MSEINKNKIEEHWFIKLVGKIYFTVVVNLALLGAWSAYGYYQQIIPQKVDPAILTDQSLNDLSQAIFQEQEARQKANR